MRGSFQKKRDIQCINCGTYGHTSKYCNFPTTSYGVICYKTINNKHRDIKYLMIQRKDTLCYVEFIRGKYEIENKDYILKLFENMTNVEQELIRTKSFEQLWTTLWIDNKKKNSDYKATKEKFNMIKKGYNVKLIEPMSPQLFFDINYILKNCGSCRIEQEWEFPKGRRRIGEDDFTCAKREFTEESGLSIDKVNFSDPYKSYEEIYLSMNKIRYRNVLYIGRHIERYDSDTNVLFDENNLNQIKEVRDVQWMTSEQVCEKLKNRYSEKIETFKMIDDIIRKKLKLVYNKE